MELNDILSSYTVNEEKSRRYAKQVCSNLKGRVRPAPSQKLTQTLVLGAIAWTLFLQSSVLPGVLSMLLLIVGLIGICLYLLHLFTWELTFDGESGWMSYHTFFKGTVQFHVSEVYDVSTHAVHSRGTTIDILKFRTDEAVVSVVLRRKYFALLTGKQSSRDFSGGYTDAGKLQQYLEMYQQFLAKDAIGQQAGSDGLSPAVRAAIAQAKREEAAQTMPGIVDALEKYPEPEESFDPVQTGTGTHQNMPAASGTASHRSAQPETEKLSGKVSLQKTAELPGTVSLQKAPVSNSTAETPQNASAFPDPAQKPKSDVDALFNNVLREFGKR